MDASYYTNASHTWVLTIALQPGTQLEYTFLDVDGAGVVEWEGGSIREVLHTYTVPKTCKGGLTETVFHMWEPVVLRRRSAVKGQVLHPVASLPYQYRQ